MNWQQPKLITLIRGKPEERVLVDCKQSVGSGPSNGNSGCYGGACTNVCSTLVDS